MAPHLRLVSTLTQSEAQERDNLLAFLSELSALSLRFGIAISDKAELYEMEPDDRLFAYAADADGRLTRA